MSPPNKRRKTQLACHPCRARKTGCDGSNPCCKSCEMRGWQDRCSYPDTKASSSTVTVAGLERRVRKLECTQIQSHITSSTSLSPPDGSADSDQLLKNQDILANDALLKSSSSPTGGRTANNPISNFSFVQQVASLVGSTYKAIGGTISGSPIPNALGYAVPLHYPAEYNLKDLILPPRPLADSVLKCYWDLFHPICPILHQPTFNATYNQLWQPVHTSSLPTSSSSTVQDVLFHGTLNIVLALGCQRNESLMELERESLANEFYRRSLALVSIDTLDELSLQVTQMLLLRGYYLLYSPYTDRCWTTTGVALRAAQAIGLHTNGKATAFNQLEREMRRRVWHNAILLDWITSLSFNRPMSLSRNVAVPLPALIDDEYLSETSEAEQPPGRPSRLAFFVSAMKLLDIRAKFRTDETYHYSCSWSWSGQELGALIDTISQLDQFLKTLPSHLNVASKPVQPTTNIEKCFQLQANTLQSRVMYGRLKLLRPLIVAEANLCISSACEREANSFILNPQDRLRKDLCTCCVMTAHDALEKLHSELGTAHRTSPWHTLYFTFAAASVLVAATLCPYLEIQFDRNPCKASWDKALQIFEFHKTHIISAEKGIEALRNFKRYIEKRSPKSPQVDTAVDREFENISNSSNSLAFAESLDRNSTESYVTEYGDFFNSMPMDQSWFMMQDFVFDDTVLQ